MAYKSVPRTNRMLTSMYWDNSYFSLRTSWKSSLLTYLFKFYFNSFYQFFWTGVFWNLNFFFSGDFFTFPYKLYPAKVLKLHGSIRRVHQTTFINFAVSKFWSDKWRKRFFIPGEIFVFIYNGSLHIIVTFYKATPLRYAVASVPSTQLVLSGQKNFLL